MPMKTTHFGNVSIQTTPMTRSDYNELRGWELPRDEAGDEDGYLVQFTSGEIQHMTWSPKDVFDHYFAPAPGAGE